MMICLEELDISYNKLGDHGAKLLSKVIRNTKTLRVLNISSNSIEPSGTTAIANALSENTSLEELCMYDTNFIGQDQAEALGSAIINNKTLKKLSLCEDNYFFSVPIDIESAMIIIKSLYSNNTITELSLDITVCEDIEIMYCEGCDIIPFEDDDSILYNDITSCHDDIESVTSEAEMVNATRKSHNKHKIDFTLHFYNEQGESCGKYTI